MKFRNSLKQLANSLNKPNLIIEKSWLYLIILGAIIINPLVIDSLTRYFSGKQAPIKQNNLVSHQVKKVNQRVFSFLDNSAKNSNSNFNPQKSNSQLLPQQLDRYLIQIERDFLTKVVILDRNGSIIASNFSKAEDESASIARNFITQIRGELQLLNINQAQQFNFENAQGRFVAQATPWQNNALGLNGLVVVAVPVESSVVQRSDRKLRYSIYLLSTTLCGLFACIGIAQLTKDLSQQLESEDRVSLDSYTFLANMSHELRSPLNAILGFGQIMEQEVDTIPESQENIAIINRSGERLLSIINDIVDLAKIETNRLTLEQNNIDFYAWLDNLEQSLSFQANNQGWSVVLIRQPDLPQYVVIDERRLGQILRNLINYCLDAQPNDHGSTNVKLKVSSILCEDTVQTNQQESSARYLIGFEVENHNLVIPATELATLFDPTTRVERQLEGSSLNLPISYKLAQLMGGELKVSNHKVTQIGIIFALKIPTTRVIGEKLQAPATLKKVIGLESPQTEYRILIVDDSKANRKIMTTLLEPIGFKVKEAVNGREAIDVWLSWQPHMIWMDLRMPVMNGYEATERIKSYSPAIRTPIVALSASTLEEEKLLFEAAGCDDFVGKPFSKNTIFDKIAQHLGIRYVYEEVDLAQAQDFKLTPEALSVMPQQWLNRVEEAANVLDRELLINLLQQIPPEQANLKNALQKQIDNFDFDKILNLAKNNTNISKRE